MSHASTATITLGGLGSGPGVATQQYSSPPAPQYNQVSAPAPAPAQASTPSQDVSQAHSQAASRRRQRRRQNVPDHMRDARMAAKTGTDFGAVYAAKPGAKSSTPAAADQTQTLFPSNQPAQVQRQGDVLYGLTPQPTISPPQPVKSEAGMIRHTPQPTSQPQQPVPYNQFNQPTQYNQPPAQYNQPPAQYNQPDPVIQSYSDADARRAAEAREKLIEMNLSPQLIEQYRRRFNVLDLNKDGVVNLREFAAISRVLGYKFSKEEILEIFGLRDLDDSGGISFDEFVIAMYERSQKTKQLAPYREKFRMYDYMGRGYITSDEAYPILRRDLGFDENKTEMMIDMFDRNKDYRLSLLEFIDFYKKVEELKQQVKTAFRDFDTNGDGYVDAQEAKAILIPKGFSDQQVDALIYKYDKDDDGKLNYQEFAAFWDVQLV